MALRRNMALLAQVSTGMAKENGTMAETYSVATELGPDIPGWWTIKNTGGETTLFQAKDLASISTDDEGDKYSWYRLHSSDRSHGLGGWTMDDAKDFLLAINGKLNHSNKKIRLWVPF